MSIYLLDKMYHEENENLSLMKRRLKTLLPHRLVKRTQNGHSYYYELLVKDGKNIEKSISEEEYVNLYKDNILYRMYKKECAESARAVNMNKEHDLNPGLSLIKKYNEKLSSVLTPPRQILSFKPDSQSQRTRRGEIVRSKSEGFIADGLLAHKIYYEYENPYLFKNILPDFYIPYSVRGYPVIWEHFGRLSSHKYLCETLEKIDNYAREGFYVNYNLIVSYELYPTQDSSEKYVFDSDRAEKIINNWFEL